MEGHATIAADIVARYAADAAREVAGVHGLVGRHLPRQSGVRIREADGRVTVEVHLRIDWGASIPDVARAVQANVREYLRRMADLEPAAVDVVVDEVG